MLVLQNIGGACGRRKQWHLGSGLIKEVEKRVEVALDIQEAYGFGVKAQLQPPDTNVSQHTYHVGASL